jgi:hypothetical protein
MAFPSRKLYDDVYGFAPQSDAVQSAYAVSDSLMNALRNGGVQSAVDPAQQLADDQFKKVMQLTQGRANELRHDPVQQQVMHYLKGVLGGKNMPYTDNTMNALKAQFGKGSASAEAAQMQTLRDSVGATGGSIYDPSYQAASREAQSQRQGANLDYAGHLNAQAGLANFQAQQNAAGMQGSLRNAQNAQINGLSQAAAGMQAGRFFEQPTAAPSAPTTLMPQYGGGGQMGMAGQAGAAGQTSAKPPASTLAPSVAPTQTALRPQQAPAEQPFANKFSFNRLLPLAEPPFQFPKGY